MKKFLLLIALLFPLLASAQLSAPVATSLQPGLVKPDGSTITLDADGTIHGAAGGATKVNTNNGTSYNQILSNATVNGTFTYSGSLSTGSAQPYRLGFNTGIGAYSSGTTVGQEEVVNLLSPWKNQWNYGNGYPGVSVYNGVNGDYALRVWKLLSSLPSTNPNPTNYFYASGRIGNIGAQQNFYANFPAGSAGSFFDLPSHDGAEFKTAMPKPWLGVSTDDPTGTTTDFNPGPIQNMFLYLTNMSFYFNTSGVASALSAFGTAPNIWGDCGWEQTNRAASGGLLENTALFPLGLSNEVSIVHSHGSTITLHIYHTAKLPNQFPNSAAATPDTAYRTSLGGHFENSYPSFTGADSGFATNFTYPAITPDTVQWDVLWFYTNGIDGIMDADTDPYGGAQGYEHYRLASVGDAILYPLTKSSGRTSWRNWTYPDGSGNNSTLPATTFAAPQLRHQLWFGHFVNHSGPETPYYANFISPDQSPASVGSDGALASGMGYAQLYENMGATNWPAGTFGFANAGYGGGVDLGWTKANYTNWYAVVGEFNFCSSAGWFTNAWNPNQNAIVTNSNFLSTWTDTTGAWPKPVFCDPFVSNHEGTNSLWIRKLSDGFAVLACNLGTISSNYNSSLVIPGGIATNVIYCATNIFSQTPFGTGFLTNNFVQTIGANSQVWIKLTPYPTFNAVTNISSGNNITATTTTAADGTKSTSVALNDTISLSQINVGSSWVTNMVTPTNSFAGTVIDFSKSESRTNLSGDLTVTAVSNLTLGGVNTCIVTMAANGANRTITFPASFHAGRYSTLVVTNGTEADFMFRLWPGIRTNVYQIDTL